MATETFFENPQQLREHDAALYGELRRLYGVDPATLLAAASERDRARRAPRGVTRMLPDAGSPLDAGMQQCLALRAHGDPLIAIRVEGTHGTA